MRAFFLLLTAFFATSAVSQEDDPVGSPAAAAAGFPLPPGAVESAELTRRLDSLRTMRWIAAAAWRVDLPIAAACEHFRREGAKRESDRSTGRGRLREWLEKNPEERAKFREFEKAQASVGVAEWETSTLRASEIPPSLGGGEAFGGPRFSARTVEIAYGTILLADAVVRVQLLAPHPSDDGRELVAGTLVAWIREARDDATPGPETVDGPETAGLAARLAGWLVMDEPVGGIVAVGVPTRRRSSVVSPRGPAGVVHSLSGPDSRGRVAYVENRAGEGRHALKTVLVDGSREEVIFSRRGEAFFEMAVGSPLALSPVGGRVAFLSRLSRFQTQRPSFPIRIGTLEIWDVEEKRGRALDMYPLDRRLSWFPDGRRLAFAELMPLPTARFPADAATDRFGEAFRGWEAVPVVKIVDVETDRRTALHLGWDPVVSSDGRTVLVRDSDNRWRQVEVETGSSRPVGWPGDAGGAIALTGDGLVAYWALPTSGSPPEFTRRYSTALGPRPMKTIKVAELSTGRFETVLPSLDPRRELSFGFAPPR